MHFPRRVSAAAITLSLALGGGIAVAHADSSSILYVDGASSACTDSGAGTEAAPYCTIQPAADAAVAGDTVDIEAGRYTGPVTIASQGTAADPIVFQAIGGQVRIMPGAINETGLIIDGASYVSFEGFAATPDVTNSLLEVYGTLVENSSHITLDGLNGWFEVAGSASDVTMSRNQQSSPGTGIQIDPGSSGDVISDNMLEGTRGGISVDDASNIAITSNTVAGTTLSTSGEITVSGASTGVTVENNIFAYPGTDNSAEILVDSAAAAGTTADYNVVWPESTATHNAAYSWAGTDYSTESAFYQATGQGEHDLVADPKFQVGVYTSYANAPQINSANGSAPGMLSTDLSGEPCSEDPAIPVTGAGSPDYCSRGAVQLVFESTAVTASTAPVTALGVALSSEISQKLYYIGPATSEPAPGVTYTVDWGDGTSGTFSASNTAVKTVSTHTYPKAGTYTITETANLLDGSTTTSTTTSFTTSGSDYTAIAPTRLLDTRSGVGAAKAEVGSDDYVAVKVAGVDSIPADVTAVALNLTVTDTTGGGYLFAQADIGGDVSPSSSILNYGKGQTIANSAIVPVGSDGEIDVYNGGGDPADAIADVSGYFTRATASGYTPVTEKRLLDTRYGTGAAKAEIPAGSSVPVSIAGEDSIPSGVTAVAVHVTVTDTTSGGWIAAEANGAGTPTTSVLNFGTGQTISNTVIVPVATDGKIELYNGGSSGAVDLIADVAGYFSTSSTGVYLPLGPYRAWDSRLDYTGLTPNGSSEYVLYDGPSIQLPAAATMITNITVTNVTGNGYVTAYPDGTARPGVSNLNYLKGQTVASLGLLATTGPDQSIDIYNGSGGSGDVILDVYGYFANS
jgi:parallel beta-helix repeat protein